MVQTQGDPRSVGCAKLCEYLWQLGAGEVGGGAAGTLTKQLFHSHFKEVKFLLSLY